MSVPVVSRYSGRVIMSHKPEKMHISLIGDNQVSVDGVCPEMDWYSCLLLMTLIRTEWFAENGWKV